MSIPNYKTFVSTSIGSFVTDRRKEIGLLFGILGGLFSLIAMIGWQATDSTLLRPNEGDVLNPCGPIGANLADLLFAIFGIGAWGLAALVATMVLGIAGRAVMTSWQWVAAVGLSVLFLAFAQLVVDIGGPHPTGGAVGYWVLAVFEAGLGRVGAGLVLVGLGVVLMTVAAQIHWQTTAQKLVTFFEATMPKGRAVLGRLATWTWRRIYGTTSVVATKTIAATKRMWSALTRQESSQSFDTTWAEDSWKTDIATSYVEDPGPVIHSVEGAPSEYELPLDAGDTVVGDAGAAVVQWEVTRPATDSGTSSGELMEMFPDFSPRPTIVERDGWVATGHGELPDVEFTAEEVVEPQGIPVPKASDSMVKGEMEAEDVSRTVGVEVCSSKYLGKKVKDDGRAVRKKDRKQSWELPPLALLNVVPDQNASVDSTDLREKAKLLEEKLLSFKVRGKVVGIRPGPVVTIFEFAPDDGIKVSSITKLSDDLALALKALSVRIVAPIPGRGVVGIEIPSAERMMIYLREMLASSEFRECSAALPCVIGKDVEGKPVVGDLAKMPHLLVGGTTGSGKSVGVNGMLMSMLFTKSADELRLLLIDPKMLEFEMYKDIPHLLHPVVTDPKIAAQALDWACREMDERYRLLARWGCRNIGNYNEKLKRELKSWNMEKARKYAPDDWPESEPPPTPESLPFIVIVIDELADLMMVASKDVENSICRIAQKARACGIHLIVATQRPSVDVVTGLIKANLPTRIAFQLRSRVDSRTVLDEMGAEQLLGMGDMLYLPPGVGGLNRCHGAFVSDDEVDRVTEFLREQVEPGDVPLIDLSMAKSDDPWSEEQDEYYDVALNFVIQKGKASTSMLQRKFNIGYNRAARIIDQMEARGVIGGADGAKPRQILVGMSP